MGDIKHKEHTPKSKAAAAITTTRTMKGPLTRKKSSNIQSASKVNA